MSEQPLVSILMPCYNHENFLPDCLDSILGQTYENIELLICDDCSPDGSWTVIESYEARLRQRFARGKHKHPILRTPALHVPYAAAAGGPQPVLPFLPHSAAVRSLQH